MGIHFQYSAECTDSFCNCSFKKTRSAHSITAQYMVLCCRLTEGHFFQLVVALANSGAALQLDGNQTDSFTLKGGLDKATNWANLQQGGCEMLRIMQLIVQISLSRTQQLGAWLRIVL